MTTWQIVSGLRRAHSFRGGSDYPYPFNQFVNAIEFVMLDFFTFFHAECVAHTTYADKLAASLLTIVILGLLAVIIGKIHALTSDGTVLRSPSVKAYIVLIYIVLPTMSSMAFSAFNVDLVRGTTPSTPDKSSASSPWPSSTHHHHSSTLEVRLRRQGKGIHDRRPSDQVGERRS